MNTNVFQSGMLVVEEDIIDYKDCCPICLNKNKRKRVFIIQKNPLIEMLACNNCKGMSASYMPTKELLDKYYAKYYNNNDLMITFHNPERFAKHLLKYIKLNFENKKIKILDFGGGDGALSVELAKKIIQKSFKQVEIMLVDYKRDIDLNSNEGINIIINENIYDINDNYDIVLASGIIEHIPESNKVINKLMSIINKNGFFYARTPYMSPFKKIIKGLDISYPSHVHDLGASFWNRFINIFKFNNLEVITSQPSIVETQFSKAFLLTLNSYLFKFPAFLESRIFKFKKDLIWNYYGGWEIFLKNHS